MYRPGGSWFGSRSPTGTITNTTATNAARSFETRTALVTAALESLVDLGYARTTGVEVCRRAGVTRGALQYHFPDFGQLLAAALGSAHQHLLAPVEAPDGLGPLEHRVHQAKNRIARPEFKAIIELWLASQNDPDLGETLANAMTEGSLLFEPPAVLDQPEQAIGSETEAVYRTINEAFIGLGIGIATNGGRQLSHHDAVVDVLQDLARRTDEEAGRGRNGTKSH